MLLQSYETPTIITIINVKNITTDDFSIRIQNLPRQLWFEAVKLTHHFDFPVHYNLAFCWWSISWRGMSEAFLKFFSAIWRGMTFPGLASSPKNTEDLKTVKKESSLSLTTNFTNKGNEKRIPQRTSRTLHNPGRWEHHLWNRRHN